jgi:hypothetical protein
MIEYFYTYIYYDPSRDNEPIYVGKGTKERAWKHFYRKNMHPFTQRLQFMKKNSIKPIIGIYAGLDEELAHLIEEELIAKFGRKDLGKGPLLNLTDGGEGNNGKIISDEVREKMSKKLSGIPKSAEHKKHISESTTGRIPSNKGGTMSDEQKKKIGNANSGNKNGMFGVSPPNKGKPMSAEQKRKLSDAHRARHLRNKQSKDIK